MQSEILLQPGDAAPNVVLDAITREGRVSTHDFRGRQPLLIGLFRGLHCPFCRRHLTLQAEIDRSLREKGIESIAVINTPIDRARLYFRYRPMPNLFAAADPERTSHQAFGLPNLEFTENETDWPKKIGMDLIRKMLIQVPDEPGPVHRRMASRLLNEKEGYEMTEVDNKMARTGDGQLFGQFLLDRDGIIRWTFTEVPEGGSLMFEHPSREELMTAVSRVAG